MDRNYAANAVDQILPVALRKESVDRNKKLRICVLNRSLSLSARRAWIEIGRGNIMNIDVTGRSPQGERG